MKREKNKTKWILFTLLRRPSVRSLRVKMKGNCGVFIGKKR